LTRTTYKRTSTGLAEYKDAVQRLSKLYSRVRELIARKMLSLRSESISNHEMTEESVGNKVQRFNQALTKFLESRKKMRNGLLVFEKSLHDLERAESSDEISTLMGLTLLSDQREYRNAMIQIAQSYEKELYPIFPEIMGIVKFASLSRESAKWATTLFNYDARTGEDDITRMIIAIRDHDIKRFNEIHNTINSRIEAEELRRH
jgi:chaperonin cofactor prefoldin